MNLPFHAIPLRQLLLVFPYAVLRVHCSLILSGEYDREVTPVPFPNTAVKLSGAHDTWLVTARENRSSPDYIRIIGSQTDDPVFLYKANREKS